MPDRFAAAEQFDTNTLNQNHPFERALKNALESNRSHTVLDGNQFNDNWGQQAMPGPENIRVDCRGTGR
jgi:hypothetical protein